MVNKTIPPALQGEDRRRHALAELFRMIKEAPFSEEFIPERDVEQSPNPLDDWAETLPGKNSAQ